MTWDRRSPWGCGWSPDEPETFPRTPATRNVIALRQMAHFDRAAALAADTTASVEAVATWLSRASGFPPARLFFLTEAQAFVEESMRTTSIVPWTDQAIEGIRL
jgi:hypothetical protein